MPAGALAAAKSTERARVNLFRAARSCLQMMAYRGYVAEYAMGSRVHSEEDALTQLRQLLDADAADAAEENHSVLLDCVVPPDPPKYTTAWATNLTPGTRLMVVVLSTGKIDALRGLEESMASFEVDSAIMLTRAALTSYSRNYLKNKPSLEHFLFEELQGLPLRHKLTPPHLCLNPELAKVIRSRYKDAKMPAILTTDNAARCLGVPAGTCIAVRECVGREHGMLTFFEVRDL